MGRPEFENQTSISAVTSKGIKLIEGSKTSATKTTFYDKVTIFAPVNRLAKIKSIQLEMGIISDQTAGYRHMGIENYVRGVDQIGIVSGKLLDNHDKNFRMEYNAFTAVTVNDTVDNSNVVSYPVAAGIPEAIGNAAFDDKVGLSIFFRHGMGSVLDAARSCTKKWVLFVEEEVIAR